MPLGAFRAGGFSSFCKWRAGVIRSGRWISTVGWMLLQDRVFHKWSHKHESLSLALAEQLLTTSHPQAIDSSENWQLWPDWCTRRASDRLEFSCFLLKTLKMLCHCCSTNGPMRRVRKAFQLRVSLYWRKRDYRATRNWSVYWRLMMSILTDNEFAKALFVEFSKGFQGYSHSCQILWESTAYLHLHLVRRVPYSPTVAFPAASWTHCLPPGATPSLFLCPHLTGDVTFGQTEAWHPQWWDVVWIAAALKIAPCCGQSSQVRV